MNDEPRRPVTGKAFVALLPVLLVYALVTVADPSGLDSLTDQWRYLAYADHITHGFYAQDHGAPDLFLWHGPLLPLLLAPFVALDVPVEVTQVLLGPLPLFAALLVFHRLALMHLAPRGALIATYALAAYLPFLTVIPTIHVEPVTTLLFTLAALFLVHAYRRQDTAEALWAGLMLGLVALSRVEYGWVVLVALVLSGVWWLVSRRTPSARLSVVAAGAAFLVCVPWLAYTFAKTEKPLYWGNSGGLSLYWMTAPGTVGDWHGLGEPLRNPKLAKSRPLFTEIRSLDPEAQDARLQHVALQNIRHDPKRYASNVINNLGRLVFESPYSFTGEQSRTMLYSLPNGLLLGALLAAFLVGLKVRRTLTPDIAPIAVLTLLGFGLHAFVSGYGRMVIPLVPVVAWLALAVLADHVRILSRPAYGVGSAQAPP